MKRISPTRKSYLPAAHRELPNSLEAEKGVLCSCLRSPGKVLGEVFEQLTTASFYHPHHRTIAETLLALRENGDLERMPQGDEFFLAYMQHLKDEGLIDKVGGPAALSDLFTFIPVAGNADYYVEIVREKELQRKVIELAGEFAERARESSGDMRHLLDEAEAAFAELGAEAKGGKIEVRSLTDFYESEIDEKKTLLGNRYLCVEGAMLFVAPSGCGKSWASMQQDALWALGREAMGIKPARPLRILTVQAENDDGDLIEMSKCMDALGLTQEEREVVGQRTGYVSHKTSTGDDFLRFLDRLLGAWKPDIIRIDPLLAFLGADPKETAETSRFCRAGLNPLLEKHQCAAIVVHHTPKTTNRETDNWKASDWMYAGAGAADLTNWARAVLCIDPTHEPGVFKFIAAKRGPRLGWTDENTRVELIRYYSHATENGGNFWRESEPHEVLDAKEAKARAKKPGKPETRPNPGQFNAAYSQGQILDSMGDAVWQVGKLQKLVGSETGMTKSTFYRLWEEIKETGRVVKDEETGGWRKIY